MNRSSHATKYIGEIDPSLYKYHDIIIQDRWNFTSQWWCHLVIVSNYLWDNYMYMCKCTYMSCVCMLYMSVIGQMSYMWKARFYK